MKSLNKQVSTLLLTATLAAGCVTTACFFVLPQFYEVQQSFNTELPYWLSWVFPSFRFWPFIGVALFVMYLFSLKPSVKHLPKFNRSAISASIFGYACSVLFVVFSILAIYWPVLQDS